jgi:hypothetical protein
VRVFVAERRLNAVNLAASDDDPFGNPFIGLIGYNEDDLRDYVQCGHDPTDEVVNACS